MTKNATDLQILAAGESAVESVSTPPAQKTWATPKVITSTLASDAESVGGAGSDGGALS